MANEIARAQAPSNPLAAATQAARDARVPSLEKCMEGVDLYKWNRAWREYSEVRTGARMPDGKLPLRDMFLSGADDAALKRIQDNLKAYSAPATSREITATIGRLIELHYPGQKLDPASAVQRALDWEEDFGEDGIAVAIGALHDACRAWRRNPENRFGPSPGQLLALAKRKADYAETCVELVGEAREWFREFCPAKFLAYLREGVERAEQAFLRVTENLKDEHETHWRKSQLSQDAELIKLRKAELAEAEALIAKQFGSRTPRLIENKRDAA